MSFSADWLALREPFDTAARAERLVAALRGRLATGTVAAPLPVVDLGAGAGSNLRYLAPRLGGVQNWRLVDHDAALLAAAQRVTQAWAQAQDAVVSTTTEPLTVAARGFSCGVTCEELDLASALPALPPGALVTAAALLDLVSASWLDELIRVCKDAGAIVHFALTYDGRTTCAPTDADDAEVLALFNRHQLGVKSFGAALGSHGAREAVARFTAAGYTVEALASDWRIGPEHRAMQEALLDGWLGAAAEVAPERRDALAAWHRRRRVHVAGGRSTLVVGHVDLIGWL
jgi:hypothetical protein